MPRPSGRGILRAPSLSWRGTWRKPSPSGRGTVRMPRPRGRGTVRLSRPSWRGKWRKPSPSGRGTVRVPSPSGRGCGGSRVLVGEAPEEPGVLGSAYIKWRCTCWCVIGKDVACLLECGDKAAAVQSLSALNVGGVVTKPTRK
ncbi:hypothetical protein Adt_03984 [Abeliophyllum distichum]|uniref:Uncharacterized protein n=1 Tax=Abeliophyllum distichum TaxID=126358 RepID=A0ABD1W0H6_9LAMI